VVAGQVGTIGVYGGYGPVVAQIKEAGIQRRLEAALPSSPYPVPPPPLAPTPPVSPTGVTFQYFYESKGFSSPQATIRVKNASGNSGPEQFDLSLITYNDAAKFNLARLDTPSHGLTAATTKGSPTVRVASKSGLAVGQAVSGPGIPGGTTIVAISNTSNSIALSSAATATANNGALSYTVASGARNVAVEGDLLTSVTAAAQAFIGLPSTAGGVSLPADALADVGVRDFLPNSSIQAASIRAVAFGAHAEENGQIVTGAASQSEDAQDMLVTGTALVQAHDTFRAPFADLATQQVQLFFVTDPDGGHFDDDGIVLIVQSVTSPNASGTANIVTPSNVARGAVTALVKVVPTYDSKGHPRSSVVQEIDLRGDGGSLQTSLPFSATGSITSTGPLGDLTLEETTLDGIRLHFDHLTRILGPKRLVAPLTRPDLQAYVDKRAGEWIDPEVYRRKRREQAALVKPKRKYVRKNSPPKAAEAPERPKRHPSPATIKKEIVSLRTAWNWARRHLGLVEEFPGGGLDYAKVEEGLPFMTWEEAEHRIAAGDDPEKVWDCVYLRPEEVAANRPWPARAWTSASSTTSSDTRLPRNPIRPSF
jgi:hypothetical protein